MKGLIFLAVLAVAPVVLAQQPNAATQEKSVSLSEAAVALDANSAPALEATLLTKGINGAPETPVTNIRMVIRNSSPIAYGFVSGVVTFYESTGVRCGESVFKADVLAANESFETDAPGIRIRCSPATWRIVATHLVPRIVPNPAPVVGHLVIDLDGEEHPVQLDKPITLNLGDKKRTIVIRERP